jgi:hypothetical protein
VSVLNFLLENLNFMPSLDTDDALDRLIIGIIEYASFLHSTVAGYRILRLTNYSTSSGYNPCHGNASALIEAVKRGVLLAGALVRS